jgi:hypothetical protein
LSRPAGEFLFSPAGVEIFNMKTVEETRRDRLQLLVEKHGGMANLVEKLGSARNETAALTRVLNANIRHERDGTPYVMGSPKARAIEAALGLEKGWMDTPLTVAEQFGNSEPLDRMASLMAAMEPEMQYKVVRMVAALSQPADGTNGRNGSKH